MNTKKRFALILVIVLMISLFATVLVACNGKSDGTNDQPSISTDDSKSGDKDNQKQQEDKKPEEEKEPTKPTIKPTVVQKKVDLSTYQLNIPANAASLGITTDTSAKASASDEEYAAISSYLAAFDEYNRLLSGVGNEITFSKARKAYYVHVLEDVYTVDVYEGEDVYEMEEVEDPDTGEMVEQLVIDGETELPVVIGRQLKLDEDGNPIFIETIEIVVDHGETVILEDEYVEDEDGNFQTNLVLVEDGRYRRNDGGRYIYAIDPDTGSRIVATDENGEYLWADDNTDEDEELADVQDECGQAEFGMDLIKLKIVNNYAFMCFALPVPEECYTAINGTVFYIQLEDGTIQPFTNADLPMRRSYLSENYDSLFYFTNTFCQSYVIDTNTGKIYPLNGVQVGEVTDDGYLKIDMKKMDFRVLDDNTLQLLDISKWTDKETVIETHRDNNGIIYLGYENLNNYSFRMLMSGSGRFPCIEYQGDNGRETRIPHVLFDKSGNAYMMKDGELKKVVGYTESPNYNMDGTLVPVFSDESYGGVGEEVVYFDSKIYWFAKEGELYKKHEDGYYFAKLENVTSDIDEYKIGWYGLDGKGIRYKEDTNYTDGMYLYTDYSFIHLYYNRNSSELWMRILITPAYESKIPNYIKESDGYFVKMNYYEPVIIALWYDVPILYNGESINSSSITRDSIQVSKPDADGFVEVTFTMGTTITGDPNYAKAQIDLQAAINEIPASITVQSMVSYQAKSRPKLDENIIIIAPLN